MLPLDHAPLQTADLSRLCGEFEALGFTVSPPGAYASPDFPQARWPCRCVFLRQGWFDLLENSEAPADAPILPRSALFRTPNLDAARMAFADVRAETPYRLERRWNRDLGLPPERFRLFALRERIAPVGTAVIEHAWPCPDIAPAWMEHANGALALLGFSFGGEPGPAARQCADRLDLSVFDYLDPEAFEARFGPGPRQIALLVKVRSLARAAAALDLRGTVHAQRGDALTVPPHGALGCAFAFFE